MDTAQCAPVAWPESTKRIGKHPRNLRLPGHLAEPERPPVSVRENVRLLGTIYECQNSPRRRVLERCAEVIHRRPQAVSKRWYVDARRWRDD